MFVAATMLTACGDNDDSSSSTSGGSGKLASCDVVVSANGATMSHACMEASSSEATKKECDAISGEETEEGMTVKFEGKFGSGCASGYKKTCTGKKEGIDVTVYIYDAMTASQFCDVILNEF